MAGYGAEKVEVHYVATVHIKRVEKTRHTAPSSGVQQISRDVEDGESYVVQAESLGALGVKLRGRGELLREENEGDLT